MIGRVRFGGGPPFEAVEAIGDRLAFDPGRVDAIETDRRHT